MSKIIVVVAVVIVAVVVFAFVVPIVGEILGDCNYSRRSKKAAKRGAELTLYGYNKAQDDGDSAALLIITPIIIGVAGYVIYLLLN